MSWNSTLTTKTPMKRTAMAKPKPKTKICVTCKRPFIRNLMGAKACSTPCALAYVRVENAKLDRKIDRARKEALKGIPELKKEAQTAFNAFIRERDKDQPCISCGTPPKADYGYHGGRDAGHYRSTGSADHMRFHEDNCHAQCVKCNQWGAGKAVDYRIGLVKRIGIERVEAVESENQTIKWTHDLLRAVRTLYRARLRELKKAGE